MRFLRRSLLVPALAVGLVTGGFTVTEGAAQQSMTFQINEENNSGVSGMAMLMPMGGGTQVVVELQNAPGPHPIHIHLNNCGPTLEPTPLVNLTPVQNGRSETMIQLTMDQLMARAHAINVHKSPQEPNVYVSCGNISMAPAAAAQPTPAVKPGVPQQPAPKPGAAPAAKPAQPAAAPAAKPAPAPAQGPAAAKPAGAPAQAPRALPRTGEAENWLIGGLALAGAALLGVGLVARRRGNSV